MEPLLAALRQVCATSTWTQGRELAERGRVTLDRRSDRWIALTVNELDEPEDAGPDATEPQPLARPEAFSHGLEDDLSHDVLLFIDAMKWQCTCSSRKAACEHVVAAAIAVSEHTYEQDGSAANRRVCQLRGRAGVLCIESAVDLGFIRELRQLAKGPIPAALMERVLDALARTHEVYVDDRRIDIVGASPGVCLKITDCPQGVLLRLEQDPGITELYTNGAIRRGRIVQPVCEHGLSKRDFVALRRGVVLEHAEAARLNAAWFAKYPKLPVLIDSLQLDHLISDHPRLELATESADGELRVIAKIVYGQPAKAEIVDGMFHPLGNTRRLPFRATGLESEIERKLARALGIECGIHELRGLEATEFARELSNLPKDYFSVVGHGHREFTTETSLTPRMSVTDDGSVRIWFEAESSEDEPDTAAPTQAIQSATASAVLSAWENGLNLAELDDGTLAKIPVEWLEKHGERIAALLSDPQEDGSSKVPSYAFADLDALCQSLDHPPPPDFADLRRLLGSFEQIPNADLPVAFSGKLRDYQRHGVDWLTFMKRAGLGALLADDMGLGKTVQALCTLTPGTLVVTPTSVLHNWRNELSRFRPDLSVQVYHGSQRQLDEQVDVTLTSYAILRLDQRLLCERPWTIVVLDEAQAIKNPTSKVARSAHALNADFRIALTGTPIENRLSDLWSQFHFLNPGLLGGRRQFQRRHGPNAKRNEAKSSDSKPTSTAATALRERIRPFVLRRCKSDVATELPPKTEIVLRCELSPEERDVYDSVRAATQRDIVARLTQTQTEGEAPRRQGNVLAVLEALLRLRQCCCHPALIPGQDEWKTRRSAKLSLLLETIQTAIDEGHKALVFSQWTSMMDLIGREFETKGLPYLRLDGRTRDRQSVVERFQSGAADAPPLLLISLRAGGVGLNLTAADHVFITDPWWNPATEDQAADRAHRIGQSRPVLVHRLVAANTVEERVLALQDHKRKLARSAVSDSSGEDGHGLTREELLALLD